MTTREEKRFNGIGYLLNKIGGVFSGVINLIFGRMLSAEDAQPQDWVDNADWAKLQQSPLRSRALLYSMLVVFVILVTWAGLASIDEVARGQGTVIPSLQTQIVQSFDGGVVEEILVHEGQIVDEGELLMRIDPTRFISSFRENRVQYLSLLAKSIRLEALTNDNEMELNSEIMAEVPEVAENENSLFISNQDELAQRLSIAQEQLLQRKAELEEIEARHTQSSRVYALASRELEVTLPLLESGAISEVEILRLQRDVSNARGEVEQAAAQRVGIRSAILEASNKLEETELSIKNEWRTELSSTLAQLSSLSESGVGLADRLKYAEIVAPVRGTVLRMFFNTVGGVVQPGREVIEMTPLDDQLIVEVKVSPKDIAFLSVGQQAMVKFTAYDFTIYGGLLGEVEQIAVDTITDEKDETYYLVRVRTSESEFDPSLPIIPGMTAQVDILTGKKTILAYLLKPILRAQQNALTER